jgi:hypothetical protein
LTMDGIYIVYHLLSMVNKLSGLSALAL